MTSASGLYQTNATAIPVPGQAGQFYYQAAFVPILVKDPSNPTLVDVRTVVLDSSGALVKKLVQLKGTPEYGVRDYRYTVVNDRPVLVDPRSRRIVEVVE